MSSRILRGAITGEYKLHIGRPDCVIGQSFGWREDDSGQKTPGSCNQQLAWYINKYFADLPLFLQWEIARAYTARFEPGQIELSVGENEAYIDTVEVLSREIASLRQLGLSRPAVVAHPHHINRVLATAQKLAPDMQFFVYPDLGSITFDPLSAQPSVRNRLRWVLHELVAYPILKIKGSI